MRNFGKIQWGAKSLLHETTVDAESFESLLVCFKDKLPSQNISEIWWDFFTAKEDLHKQFKESIKSLAQQPFLAAYFTWIKEVVDKPPAIDIDLVKTLLTNDFIGIKTEEGTLWTVEHAKSFDHSNVMEAIRCHRTWPLGLRENLVKTYLSFMQWLSTVTFGYISKCQDPDLLRCQSRALPHPVFIDFLVRLSEKDQLVAKLLYFGGSKTLEEILTVKIEDINFNKRYIRFNVQDVTYPLHVFADIAALSDGRESGLLFIGRQKAPLNAATVFRNFKEAAVQIGLGNFFTPKRLTTND